MQEKTKERILDVAYHSQLLEIPNTIDAVRGCGITCLKMILDFYQKESETLEKMNELGKKDGGYSESGWIHDYFVKVLNSYGLIAERREKIDFVNGLKEIVKSIEEGNPVIISVKRIFCELEYFHMLVITGFKRDEVGELKGLYYHEPFSTSKENGTNKYLSIISEKEQMYGLSKLLAQDGNLCQTIKYIKNKDT